ncbi:histidine kinase [Rhodospirillum rubrum]|uniref:stimulus-sensing domain-containing protein n=1 Tax=Rhodospirillum rubrum TaxID=1085 RepID=UPI001903E7F8|nr:stimulus-sensing domain-containing protein [Rhodospirillum rubrum]MBK1665821.1 histidine kinase [Rhodospirillum rubrum]MBK1678228.1 histidine kinase [Rhodospirillum rubrum]
MRADPGDRPDSTQEPKRRRHWRPRGLLRSPLSRRILAVNLIAPILLAGGFLYLDTYEDALTASTFQAMRTEADLIAAAIGEGAINLEVSVEGPVVRATHGINPEMSRQMVRRLANLAEVRARLFDTSGTLVADSRRLVGYGGMVQVMDLPPPVLPDNGVGLLRRFYDAIIHPSSDLAKLQPYVERPNQSAGDYPEVLRALTEGESGFFMRVRPTRDRVLSVAVPVQYYKQVVGAVMVSRGAEEIDETLFEMRLGVIEIFAFTLALTILLSFYIAGTIVRPLLRLAGAADRVRHGKAGRHEAIPDFSNRRDELGDLSAALREMTEVLWARMDAIERFAADVAHEIKNPLTSLRSAVETVARIDDPNQQKRLMAVIVDDVQRLNRLITDISDASRLDAELSRAEMESVEIRPMLEMLAEVHAAEAEQRGVTIKVMGDAGDALGIEGLEGRLVQVFRNLIGNAVSFSPPGGTITLRAWRTKGKVVITVADDGPGIPPGKEGDIFKRFYSERPREEKFGTHSGLGLSISQQIVETHRGTIRAENRRDGEGKVVGAIFTVELPSPAPGK